MYRSFSLLGAAPHSPGPGLFRDPFRLGFVCLIWLGATSFCAAAGPFGTYDALSFPARLGYWGGVIGLALALAMALRLLMNRVPSAFTDHPRAGLAISFVYAAGLGLLIGAINLWLMPSDAATVGFFAEHVAVVLVICLVSGAARTYFGTALGPDTGHADTAAIVAPQSPFFKRLSPELGEALVRVSADNHYLEVVTERGEERILMRFRDAVDELEDVPGMQVHRSHWVSRAAIVGVRRVGRGHTVDLSNGDAVPASRGYLDALRDAGLLD